MNSEHRVMLLGLPADLLTMDQSVRRCEELIMLERFAQHVVINAAKVVACADDDSLARAISAADVVNIDGMSVVWAGRLLGHQVPERVAGIDLMERLLEVSEVREWPVFLLGARAETLTSFESEVLRRFPRLRIAGTHDGYFEQDEQVADRVRGSGARLLLIGMSSPRKEEFVDSQREALGALLAMGVGGSFDVWAGNTRRAPGWMQRSGLEWLYRVLQEPQRMWRRYLIGNTRFIAIVIRAWMGARFRNGAAPPARDD